MITVEQYLNQWRFRYGYVKGTAADLTDGMRKNAGITVSLVNAVLTAFGHERGITSGWRPVAVNKLVPGAALLSNHTKCLACDVADADGQLGAFCLANLDLLKQLGLWLESPLKTPGWCHLQIVPPKSGNRVFMP